MGLLDDAIREHLDLKRRRGADPAEIERAEREALGPVRRAPAEAGPPELELDDAHRYDELEQDEWDHGYEADAPAAAGATLEPELRSPHIEPSDRAPLHHHDDPLAEDEPYEDEEELYYDEEQFEEEPPTRMLPEQPAEHAAPPPHRAPTPSDQLGETVEYDVERALEEEHGHPPAAPPPPADAGHDTLEETPEFLQDTPDHDRLWFEQRPPKDFDFDG
jgi:hypothetical protein